LQDGVHVAQQHSGSVALENKPSGPPRFTRSPYFIVLVALILRIAVIGLGHTDRITPRRDHFQFGWEMGRIARSLAEGKGFSSPTDLSTGPTAWAPPLYPYLLAGVFKVFGAYTPVSAFVILSINSVFAALTCVVIYRIGCRTVGTTPARWAAWTWAVFPYAIYWPVRVVWETSLSTFLLALAVLQTLRLLDWETGAEPAADDLSPGWSSRSGVGALARAGRAMALGLLWGSIALTNPTMLSVLPFLLGWFCYRSRRKPSFAASQTVLVLAVGCALIAPWLVRNYVVFGRWVFIRDNFWMELHLANNDRSDGYWTRAEHPGNDPEQMRRFQQLGEIEYMRQERKAALGFIAANPGRFVRYCLQRAAFFWIGNPQRTLLGNWNLGPARHTAFLLSAAAAFAGLWLAYRHCVNGRFLFAVLLLVYPLPYYVAHPSPRYRHAIEPVMILLITYGLFLARGRRLRLPRPA
jgi:4-amino-4-deoxy-L-arabinose transferase-like glycosyltransferase